MCDGDGIVARRCGFADVPLDFLTDCVASLEVGDDRVAVVDAQPRAGFCLSVLTLALTLTLT